VFETLSYVDSFDEMIVLATIGLVAVPGLELLITVRSRQK